MDAARHHTLLRALSLAPLLLAGLVYLLHPGVRASLDAGVGRLLVGDVKGLQAWAADFGAAAPLATSLLMVIQALAAPIPAVLVTAANSLMFGPLLGGALSIVQATVAAALCYALGRGFGEPLARRLISERAWRKSGLLMAEYGARAVLVARLLPLVPFDPISYLAGVARIPFGRFSGATLLGQIPAGMGYAYLFANLDDPRWFAILAVCTLSALVVFGWTMARVLRRPAASAGLDGEGEPGDAAQTR